MSKCGEIFPANYVASLLLILAVNNFVSRSTFGQVTGKDCDGLTVVNSAILYASL